MCAVCILCRRRCRRRRRRRRHRCRPMWYVCDNFWVNFQWTRRSEEWPEQSSAEAHTHTHTRSMVKLSRILPDGS